MTDSEAIARWARAQAATVIGATPRKPAERFLPPGTTVNVQTTLRRMIGFGSGALWGVATHTMADGTAVVAGGHMSGRVDLWNTRTGEHLTQIRSDPATRRSWYSGVAALSIVSGVDSDALVVIGDHNGRLTSWSMATQVELTHFEEAATTEYKGYLCMYPCVLSDGRNVLAFGGFGGTIRLFDPIAGSMLAERRLTGMIRGASVAACRWHDGRDVVAVTAGRAVELLDLETLQPLMRLLSRSSRVTGVAFSRGGDGSELLLATTEDALEIWTPPYDTEPTTRPTRPFRTGARTDSMKLRTGESLIASNRGNAVIICTASQSVEIWLDHDRSTQNLAFGTLPEGPYLVTACDDGHARIWALDIEYVLPDGTVVPHTEEPLESTTAEESITVSEDEVSGLLRLSESKVCPPLGLLAALTGMLGGQPPASPALDVLGTSHGFQALRSLSWPRRARIGLAALLIADLPTNPNMVPPPAPRSDLRRALRQAIGQPAAAGSRSPVPVGAMLSAAETITDQTIALLRLVGPEAVAADPLLPRRLRDQADQMVFAQKGDIRPLVSVISAASKGDRASGGSPDHAAGVVGIAPRGRITSVPQTQLALPPQLFEHQLLAGGLLYRQFDKRTALPPKAATVVLDTSPATFGPIEVVLRSVAHALVCTMWEMKSEIGLVLLDSPEQRWELHDNADLTRVWTSRSLKPPLLEEALATASRWRAECPAILLTEHRLVEDRPVLTGPMLRLLTTGQPGESRMRLKANQYSVHLSPDATSYQIAEAVRSLLGLRP